METQSTEEGYQDWDYNSNTGDDYWEQGQESNYNNFDYEPAVPALVENHAQQAEEEDWSLHQNVRQQEYTSSEAPHFDYSSYEYDYVPNYLDETPEDDFRYVTPVSKIVS